MLRNTLIILSILCSSCAYTRIGDLTMISNRNVDSSKEYVWLERNVEAKSKTGKEDSLEEIIDEMTETSNGDYLMNAKLYVKSNGKKIKIQADVWGEPAIQTNILSSVEANNNIAIGDQVSFKAAGKIMEGKILGINSKAAIVEFVNLFGKTTKKEVSFAQLTKLQH